MRIGSLFSGIGGLELGLEWAGLGHTVWQVERDPYCRAVLAKHWPDAERFDDVCTVGASTLAPVDLICGGFPCQDVSGAGKGAGLAGERSGLWREYARIVGELQPRWVVVENVLSGATRWLDVVMYELEQLGYEALPVPLSAEDVGAPHRRRRIFVVASNANGVMGAKWYRDTETREIGSVQPGENNRIQRVLWGKLGDPASLRRVDDGVSDRVDRVRALGNAVVPQCAEVVGYIIRELEGW